MNVVTPKSVIFDMDGTLLDTETVYLEAMLEAGRGFGLDDMTPTFLKIVGTSGPTQSLAITEGLEGKVELDVFSLEWDALIAARFAQGMPLKNGAVDLLNHLDVMGIPVAVATSTRYANAMKHLEAAGIHHHFAHVLGGDQVTRRKPHPEPYLRMMELLDVAAAECVIFEDSDTGTRSAVSSGAIVVQVPDIKQPDADIADLGHLIAPTLMDGAREIGLL